MTTPFRRERNSVTNLLCHLVCVTKKRRKIFTSKSLENIEESFRSVAEKMNFEIREFNGESDHVHVLLEYPPKLSISQMVNSLKGVSSRKYRSTGFRCPTESALWSPSYFCVSVGGAPLEILKQYIENQQRPV
ncbi:IS200/IS605 family transposase [cf. Phormidesmis sp. LEGE 11477]|uniref:IS200/IS605 family transposase n=1 Tax=cf. Phormidesmis sp. LEGE 11477 TaxID=1828680 RepID=UPI0018814BC0|nr:IS200/IS605 family transposase [cf. Phormidesmis sp. LEGE 11477]MBE9062234.1 IS200/IS605 family transposase [cf. Phormidesmis sp. LEGE 11477]